MTCHYNLSPIELLEHALKRNEGHLGNDSQLCVVTGDHTGRAADDKYIVEDDNLKDVTFGKAGVKIDKQSFITLANQMVGYMQGHDHFIIDFIAAGKKCRVMCEKAWHALFVTRMFEQQSFEGIPDLTIIDLPAFYASPEQHGTKSKTFIVCNFIDGVVLIGGTSYAGEIKKSVFSYLSYIFPESGVLPMHSSVTVATRNANTNTTVFFGLSGTGKTTLSADRNRFLVGDDEHGWSDEGVFNFEAGCYAKIINLSSEKEPAIWAASNKFLTVLENIQMTDSREIDFSDSTLTENTRAAYKLSAIDNSLKPGTIVNHPKNIIMLTCDAYGVLPGIAKLDKYSAAYHFISGYTAKVSGTEKGITTPSATFSACFGQPFMLKNVNVYADLLIKKIEKYQPSIWLVNTGWVGGGPGIGNRMDINETRAIIDDVNSGRLDQRELHYNETFNLFVPQGTYNMAPRHNWTDKIAYDRTAKELVQKFMKNIEQYELDENTLKAGMSLNHVLP